MTSMHLRRAVEYTPTQARDCVRTRKQPGRVTLPPHTAARDWSEFFTLRHYGVKRDLLGRGRVFERWA